MLTLTLLLALSAPPQAPCPPQTVLPVVDDVPKEEPVQVIYRIGSLPPTWVPPAPVVYPQVIYPTPTYTLQAVPWCPPGG